MLKVGDILWTFDEDGYFIGEISKLSLVNVFENAYYCVDTNGIIGSGLRQLLPTKVDYNTLVTLILYNKARSYTISEKEAIKFIESHFND